MPRPARARRATTSGGSRTALSTSHSVPGFLGHADAERFPETALPRRGDDHRAAVLRPLRPPEIEAPLRERGPDRARDVWPSLGPVDTESAKGTALRAQRRQVEAELREKSGPRRRDLGGLVAHHDVLVRDQRIGEINAETAGEVVIADSSRAELACSTGEGAVARPVFERDGHDPVEHLGDPRRREPEIAVPTVPGRRDQPRLGELRQMRAGGLRRHPGRTGQLGRGERAAIEKRREHRRPRRLSDQPGNLGYQWPGDHRRNVAPGTAAPQVTTSTVTEVAGPSVDASITVEVFIGTSGRFGGKIALRAQDKLS